MQSPSPASVFKPQRLVDNAAVIIRNASVWADWGIGRLRPDCDFVATAEESYAIAAPLAGYLLDNMPVEGPLAELAERAGVVGAGASLATYLARAARGLPGGREESAALRERGLRKLVRAKRRHEDAPSPAPEAAPSEPGPRPPSYSAMLGLDEDFGIGIPQ